MQVIPHPKPTVPRQEENSKKQSVHVNEKPVPSPLGISRELVIVAMIVVPNKRKKR